MKYFCYLSLAALLAYPVAVHADERKEKVIDLLGQAKALSELCGRGGIRPGELAGYLDAEGLDPEQEFTHDRIEQRKWFNLYNRFETITRTDACTAASERYGRKGIVFPGLLEY